MRARTKNGHDFFAVSSLMQKAIRRGDVTLASRAVCELLPKYGNYVWNRLLVVSAEDCSELVTGEVMACYLAWCKLNDANPRSQRIEEDGKPGRGPRSDMAWDGPRGGQKKGSRVFFMKAVVLLCKAVHCRDADEIGLLVADRLPEKEFTRALRQAVKEMDVDEPIEIPDYVYDVHTRRGKREGKTREDFLRQEHAVMDKSMFLNFDEMVDAWGYIEPVIDWD